MTKSGEPSRSLLELLRTAVVGSVSSLDCASSDQLAALFALADEHRLSMRIGARLAAQSSLAESSRVEPFIQRYRHALGERALFDRCLEQLAVGARAHQLKLVALKGVDLARRLYEPGERSHNDVDLLVAPAQRDLAVQLLHELGYRCDHPDPTFALAHWFAVTFRHHELPRLQIDLHWSLGSWPRTRWDVRQILERAERFPNFDGLWRLASDDLLAHLALHAVAFHGAAGRWIWWLDIALLNPQREVPPAWRRRAREVGGEIALDAALRRAHTLFGDPAPHPDHWRARWIARCGARAERQPSRLGRWLVAALAVDRPLDLLQIARQVTLRRRSAG